MTINKEELIIHRNSGKPYIVYGIKYRVGLMSYGQWFLEPGRERSENDGFNSGTLWLEKDINGNFQISEEDFK